MSKPSIKKDELCDFLGLDPNGFDASVTFEASSFGRWKKKFSSNEVQMIESQLGEAIAHFGYAS